METERQKFRSQTSDVANRQLQMPQEMSILANKINQAKNGKQILNIINNELQKKDNEMKEEIWRQAIHSCGRLRDFATIMDLHEMLIKHNNNEKPPKQILFNDIFSYNTLLNALCVNDRVITAYGIYVKDLFENNQMKPETRTLNILLKGCKRRADISLANKIWNNFKMHKITPDIVSYATYVSICARAVRKYSDKQGMCTHINEKQKPCFGGI